MNELPLSKRKQLQQNVYDSKSFRNEFIKESDLQRACEEYLDWKHISYYRIPDAVYAILFGKDSKLSVGDKSFISKYLKGLKDLLVLVDDDGYFVKGLVIELKSTKGKMSQGQKNKHKNLPTHIIRDFDSFKKKVEELEWVIK